jgi:hypothetical protein
MVATEMPISRPPTTSEKVDRVCFVSVPVSNERMNRFHTLPGEGSINSGNSVHLVTAYHKIITKMIVNKVKNTLPNRDFGLRRKRLVRLFPLVRTQVMLQPKKNPGGLNLRGSFAVEPASHALTNHPKIEISGAAYAKQQKTVHCWKPSTIRTLPSALEFHQIMRFSRSRALPPVGIWRFVLTLPRRLNVCLLKLDYTQSHDQIN